MRLKREAYLRKIRPYYTTDLIKIITGVRRAGKSILLDTIKDELIADGVDGTHLIYINFNTNTINYEDTCKSRWLRASHLRSAPVGATL